MKTAIFVDSVKDLENYKKHLEEDIIFITNSLLVKNGLIKEKKKVIALEDLLTDEDYNIIGRLSEKLADSWYKDIKEKLAYGGIDVANCCFFQILSNILPIIKKYYVVRKFVKVHSPKKILLTLGCDELKRYFNLIDTSIDVLSLESKKPKTNIFGTLKIDLKSFFLNNINRFGKRPVIIKNKVPLLIINNFLYYYDIIKELEKNKADFLCYAFGYSAAKTMVNHGHPFFSDRDFYNRKIKNKIKEEKKHLYEILNNKDFLHELTKIKIFETNFHLLFKDIINEIFIGYLIDAVKYIEIWNNFLDKANISKIVCGGDTQISERALFYIAKQRKIETIELSHGVLAEKEEIYPHLSRMLADKYLVWGDLGQSVLKKFLPNSVKIIKVGCPWHKDIPKQTIVKKTSKNPTVLFTSSPISQYSKYSDYEQSKDYYGLYNAISKIKEVNFLIKPHYGENIKLHKEFLGEKKLKYRLLINTAFRKYNLKVLLEEADLVIVENTTVGLEAIMIKKPTILINFTKFEDQMPFVREKAILGVYKKNNALKLIKKMLFDEKFIRDSMKNYDKYIKRSLFKTGEDSARTVIKILLE